MMVRWIYAAAVAVVTVGIGHGASGADVTIKLTNKSGNLPRSGVLVSYTVWGINVDDPNVPRIQLFRDTDVTDGDGALRIDVERIEGHLSSNADVLGGSHRIRITLLPFSTEETLDTVEAEFLLGSTGQNMTMVMMEARGRYRAIDATQVVYHGRRGNFHLTGAGGTAYYTMDGKAWLATVEHYRTDNQYIVYREVGGVGRYWAFERNCSECGMCCGKHRKCSVWRYDRQGIARWRIFEWASKSLPANADAFESVGVPVGRTSGYRSEGRTADYRVWEDVTGRYKRNAAIDGVDVQNQMVHLIRQDTGQRVSVALDRLSDKDRQYVSKWMQIDQTSERMPSPKN